MNRDDPPKVMMLHLEEVHLFFLAHPDGGRECKDVQLICQAIKDLRTLGYLYKKALSIWNANDLAQQMVLINFKTNMYAQYRRMLAKRGGGTLANDRN